uniref:Uncharacterized protein n=1 Tax=Sphaerodactylus townsendi TaxID=933632 RepID=A0ACB8FCV7_9SAUR
MFIDRADIFLINAKPEMCKAGAQLTVWQPDAAALLKVRKGGPVLGLPGYCSAPSGTLEVKAKTYQHIGGDSGTPPKLIVENSRASPHVLMSHPGFPPDVTWAFPLPAFLPPAWAQE